LPESTKILVLTCLLSFSIVVLAPAIEDGQPYVSVVGLDATGPEIFPKRRRRW
jgi:hypothetical protein